jgi:hypothetical protein
MIFLAICLAAGGLLVFLVTQLIARKDHENTQGTVRT